jgi:hypothetical protein
MGNRHDVTIASVHALLRDALSLCPSIDGEAGHHDYIFEDVVENACEDPDVAARLMVLNDDGTPAVQFEVTVRQVT